MTWSAPIERTMSRFWVLVTPVTSVPNDLGNLHRKRSYATARTINQYLLAGLDVSMVAKSLQCGESGHRDGSGFLKRAIGWFRGQPVFASGSILCKGTG